MGTNQNEQSSILVKQLQESERRFRVMADIAPVNLWMSDVSSKCIYFNQTWLNFTGRTLDQELGDGWTEGIHPDDRQLCMQGYLTAFGMQKNFQMEYRLRRADGQYRWILDTGTPRYLPDGTFAGYIGSCTDITELKNAHEILERKVAERTAELRESNKELEAFSYSVSHDLRTPLRTIDGFSERLVKNYSEQIDEKGKAWLQRVRAASQRMGQLIDDLLKLSRLQRAEMQFEKVDLSALARSIAAALTKESPKREITFDIIDGLLVDADPNLMQIAVENLFQNSWKFTSTHPTARIELGILHQSGPRVYYVRDDGVGFENKFADRLFHPFQRLHSLSEFPGTGIGLAIVRRIIQKHGGRVWAEAAPEKGATIYFTLMEKEEGKKAA